jgi:hypothetical protein
MGSLLAKRQNVPIFRGKFPQTEKLFSENKKRSNLEEINT